METQSGLSRLAHAVIDVFEVTEAPNHEPKMVVNRFVSELATWYERLRNAMELQDDAIVLIKNAIERILKRRLLLGGTGDKVAEPLLRELVWARYFPDNSLPQSYIQKTAHIIDLYLELKHQITLLHPGFSDKVLNEWISQLMACHIAMFLSPNKQKNAMSNFMFHIVKDHLVIEDDSEDTKNVQVYIAVHRAFAKDDLAFLRFYLFKQIFPPLTAQHIPQIAESFLRGYEEIQKQLHYPLKEKIYLFVKRQAPIFIILEDVLKNQKGNIHGIISNSEELGKQVLATCEKRYQSISSKVRNAIIRSVIFLIITKVAIAYAVEGTYDTYKYGHIIWNSFIINIVAPPLLMVLVSFFIRTPDIHNSRKIFDSIRSVLFEEKPALMPALKLAIARKKQTLMATIFALLWIFTFGLSFYLIYLGLNKIQFNFVDQGVFMFFIAVVSFLSYRINLTANSYTIERGQGLLTPFIDILFFPVIRVGMWLTDGISQINIIIFVFDFLIEAPFKVIFEFFEGLFGYLHAKREDLE